MRSIQLSAFTFPSPHLANPVRNRHVTVHASASSAIYCSTDFLFCLSSVRCPENAPAASQGDHYLLNATSAVVVLNEVFAAKHTIITNLIPATALSLTASSCAWKCVCLTAKRLSTANANCAKFTVAPH